MVNIIVILILLVTLFISLFIVKAINLMEEITFPWKVVFIATILFQFFVTNLYSRALIDRAIKYYYIYQ